MLTDRVRRRQVRAAILLLAGLMLAFASDRSACGQGSQPAINIEFARFSPAAIFSNGVDSTTLRVRVSGPVTRVQAVLPNPGGLKVDGAVVQERFGLFDDGTHGDEIAGDQLFTRSGIASRNPGFGPSEQGLFAVLIALVSRDGQETIRSAWPDGQYFLMSAARRPEITHLSTDLQVTPYLANFQDDSQLFQVGDSLSGTQPPDLRGIARRFYEHFPDDYDFLAVFTPVVSAGGILFHQDVRNDVQGIGKPLFDQTADYGSTGRLRGVSFHQMTGAGGLTHEVMHQWGVFLNPGLELGDGTGHWGAVNIPGYLQGLDFRHNPNGSYLITWTRFGGLDGSAYEERRLPPMELYLMGLLSPEEVSDITVLEGVDPNRVKAGEVVVPRSVRRVTIQEIIAQQGPRVPDSRAAPNSFHMAGILITSGRLASPAEMAVYSRVMEHFGSEEGSTLRDLGVLRPSFRFATGGRGWMNTVLGAPR